MANWQGVAMAAMMLNDACVRFERTTGMVHNGGGVTAGEGLRLRVGLWRVKAGGVGEGGRNGTGGGA